MPEPPDIGSAGTDPAADTRDHPGVTVSRDDVEIGQASEAAFEAADTDPVADESSTELEARLGADKPTERQRAALALAERDPSAAVIETLADRAASDPDALVRQFAVEALGEVGETPPEAVIAACKDPDPWVRAEAIVALDHLDRENQADRLATALDDDHHAVRRNAVISLWKLRGEDALDALLAMADDESERVREWVAELLGRIDHPDAEAALTTLQTDESSVVGKTAANALGDASPPPGSTSGTDPTNSRDQPPRL